MEVNYEAQRELSMSDLLAIANEHKKRSEMLSQNNFHEDATKHIRIASAAIDEYNSRLENIYII